MFGPENTQTAVWVLGGLICIFFGIFILMAGVEDNIVFKNTTSRRRYRMIYLTSFAISLVVLSALAMW